jgi:hypothetical protein
MYCQLCCSVPTVGWSDVCVDSNIKFINLCQCAYWHCVSHVHCYLHLIVLPPGMAPNCDMWVFTAVLGRIQVTGMRRCRSATPHSAASQKDWNLKLFVVRRAAIFCLRGRLDRPTVWSDSKQFYTYICKMSSFAWDMQNWTLRHPHHESPVQTLLQLLITAQGSIIFQIKFNQYQLISNNQTVHCTQERTRKGGLCFCASVRIQVASLLTHIEHCASHCPVEMPNIFETPRLSFLLGIRQNVSPVDS